MTDARYPERWLHDRRLTRLPDKAHRAFVVTLAYGVANRTDGVVLVDDFRDLPKYVEGEVPRLLAAGLWEPLEDGTGYRVVDFLDTQTSRAELEAADAARVAAREKKARQRAAAKGKPADPAVPGDVPGDGPEGQHRLGQDRTGQALSEPPPTELKPWQDVQVTCVCSFDLPAGEHFDYCTHVKASA